MEKKNIKIYTGQGAYMAKDVENFLSRHNFDYGRLHEIDIQQDKLKDCDVFIIGGGAIYDILPALGKKGIKNIQNFVKSGGKYIGICAGAYIAPGLGLTKTQFKRGKGEKIIKVDFQFCGEKINLYYCNGPLIDKLSKDDLLIAVDKTKKIGVIKNKYGKGLVYLFCAHPEGNLFSDVSAEKLDSNLYFKKILSQ